MDNDVASAEGRAERRIWPVILASSVGTLIEWYDFYIFGALASILSKQFFPSGNEAGQLLSLLATFAIGFVVRPFGALFFGRIGDIVGRKYTFLVTLLVMGGSTVLIGFLPSFAVAGWITPVAVIVLRLAQGLALGGEYGGAATYVAEHCPDGKRGFYTSFIQTTATLGLFVSLVLIMACQNYYGKAAFEDWAWRVPFWLSSVLVAFSLAIRVRMAESPLFAHAKNKGKTSANPLRDSFMNPENRRLVLIALFGATMGQGVVWYTSQFQTLYFLKSVVHIDGQMANWLVATALMVATPLFVFFGWLSDRIGRKPIIMAGCALGALAYFPAFHAIAAAANYNPATPKAAAQNPDLALIFWIVVGLVTLVTMVYGPIAAFLVELFPTRIRYTSMSLPYHIGNGVFGGMVPFTITLIQDTTKDPFIGFAYPVVIAAVTFVVGSVFIKERRDVKMWDEEAAPA
ncbi:MAG: MHS family MFS transporter [Fimbriimonadaceae bacterium]|nr:MHS family MFS transporter [Fimbriimonadaceae bacterium]